MKLRPLGHYVLVRPIDGAAQAQATPLVVPAGARSFGTYHAEVLSCGRDVVGMTPGDVVVVQAMSGHPSSCDLRDDDDRRLAIVPCQNAIPAQRSEEEHDRLKARDKALRQKHPEGKARPPAVIGELMAIDRRLREIRSERSGRARTRQFKPVRDRAKGEGVLAVIEER